MHNINLIKLSMRYKKYVKNYIIRPEHNIVLSTQICGSVPIIIIGLE